MLYPPPLETLHPVPTLDGVAQDLLIGVEEVPGGHDQLVGMRASNRNVVGVLVVVEVVELNYLPPGVKPEGKALHVRGTEDGD